MKFFKITVDSLDAWAKICDDLAKVAILAIPPSTLFEKSGNDSIMSTAFLFGLAIVLLSGGLFFRNIKLNLKEM